MGLRSASLFFALALLAGAVPVSAAVKGSAHDLTAQGYDVPKGPGLRGSCTPCHMPAGVKGKQFQLKVPPSLAQYDFSSLVCFSCHDGTTLVNSDVDASLTAFHPLSHRYDLQGYRDRIPRDGTFPHTDGDRMSCMTCHDPHDNGNRPFLRASFSGLCQVCHAAMGGAEGSEHSAGNHPVGNEFPEGGRESMPLEMNKAFRVAFPQTYPLGGGRSAIDVHWNLGGHLDGGDTGALTCPTCHVVHGDEEAPPMDKLLTVDPVREKADEFCESCHRGERGDENVPPPFPNPGGTLAARTYHPADDDLGRTTTVIETVRPPRWTFGTAPVTAILCTTCHIAHGASPETPLLRKTEAEDFCEECHSTLPGKSHHPVSQGRCSENLPSPAYGGKEGKMYCSTCHRAHNAGLGTGREEEYTPILRSDWDPETSCFRCHPEDDPTCDGREGYTASHFIGDPTLVDTYDDADPPLWTEPWPESGISSFYGGDKGKSVTCLSCHTFEEGAITSGDKEDAGYLVARSGNPVEWEEGGEGRYLCTGCHSTAPSTKKQGHTHPLMDADLVEAEIEPILPVTATIGGHINCDSCHRPHGAIDGGGYYIMEVVDSPNTDPMAIHPVIDFTVICHQCHSASEY